jgi:hypothetical protein
VGGEYPVGAPFHEIPSNSSAHLHLSWQKTTTI